MEHVIVPGRSHSHGASKKRTGSRRRNGPVVSAPLLAYDAAVMLAGGDGRRVFVTAGAAIVANSDRRPKWLP